MEFAACRKKNARRCDDPRRAYYKETGRKRVETTFSRITNLLPKKIHAVTLRGFSLKVTLFVVAFAIEKAFI